MIKAYKSCKYNYLFNTDTGFFMRWGETPQDDPDYSPIGPEILDIEVSTICHKGCKFCYKGNVSTGVNMTFDTFKQVIDKMPTVLQIAFGIGDISANPDLWRMFEYCREKNIIPNVTVNGVGITSDVADLLKKFCGAVAVSVYDFEDTANTVKKLTDRGMDQVNIHYMLSQETLPRLYEFISFAKEDSRMQKVNAIVLLSLKQKGRGIGYTSVTKNQFHSLMSYLLEKEIRFGADSCTANKILAYLSDYPEYAKLATYIEPCESGLFSQYVDVNAKWFPCSFVTEPYFQGIDLLRPDIDFLKDVWYNEKVMEWRENLLQCGRGCPVYKV